jgi:xylan 1,4-beta-xylosidase
MIAQLRRLLVTAMLSAAWCAATGVSIGDARAQTAETSAETVRVHVRADKLEGPLPPIWNYWGYDEPNYTYPPNGKKLLRELAALSPEPVYIRTHNLFTTGDGTATLKWGSTNVYTEDAAGKPAYDWTIIDHIFDTYRDASVKPLIEIGFMPEAMSTHPDPYRHDFPKGSIFTGWAYPPKDFRKWAELVFQFAKHLRERYGDAEVKTWLWEVWNEPDIDYWKGTPEEYFELYDYSVDAVQRAIPGARVGGPDSTGPGSPKAIAFLRGFLEHCARGKNFATGANGARLDFISFHPKGSPKWVGDHVQMGIARQLTAIQQGFQIVASYPQWKRTPIILGESDPEGCAACSAENNPANGYRNGPLYASYTAATLNNIYTLAKREGVNFQAEVNWSFEFEDQPYFAGFREMASNGLDKPVLNTFRMFGMLGKERVSAESTGGLLTDQIISAGVRAKPDIGAIAARKDNEVEVLLWNYHDDDLAAADAPVELTVTGLPAKVPQVVSEHFRIDGTHSNSYAAWKAMGSPQNPSESQYRELETAGQLQLLESPAWNRTDHGTVTLKFSLPRQGMSLLRLAW